MKDKQIEQELRFFAVLANQEIARCREVEDDLTQLQAKLDNIHSIARKYL